MKVVILAGGQQSTIADEREGVPKPMAKIGGQPLLWHIMKQYSHYGYHEFIICGGYKVNTIKDFFADYYIYQSDITVDLADNTVTIHKKITEDWKVTVVDTGLYATTGQRIGRIEKYIEEDAFIVTYGDCLSDIDVEDMVNTYKEKEKVALMAVARPTGRNVLMPIDGEGRLENLLNSRLTENQAWANACTYVFDRRVFYYLQGNYELDKQLFLSLADKSEIVTYKHAGFWCPVETRRDKTELEGLWNSEMAPWKVWRD